MAKTEKVVWADNVPGRVMERLVTPLQALLSLEPATGIVLLVSTLIALFWANSSWSESYFHLIHVPVHFQVGNIIISQTLLHFVNDGLMVVFFYMVGLEIKRELLFGDLSIPSKAAFSIFGAFGGMVVPALIYIMFNPDPPTHSGWGIPMATDIAFAVGVLALAGRSIPNALKIFLLALAIVDDLGAVLVIAFFYSEEILAEYLGLAALALFVLVTLAYTGVRHIMIGLLLGLVVWYGFLKSGVHATIAGVLLAFITPAHIITPSGKASRKATKEEKFLGSPVDSWLHRLHPWVSFGIMPVFAFFNAGVDLRGSSLMDVLGNSVSQGIGLGLVLGKPIGICIACALAVKFGRAQLPSRTSWLQVIGVGMLGGIGFTMSLFISGLAFGPNPAIEVYAKSGILLASTISGVFGFTLLKLARGKNT